jgi:hypothetical protein
MLYQVLTGMLPHRDTDTIDEILGDKRRGVPVPRFDRVGRPIPRPLGALVASLTDPDLRRRPRFAANVLEALRAAATVLRATATPPPAPRPSGSGPAASRPAGTELLPTRPFGAVAVAGSAALGASASPRSERAPHGASGPLPSFVPATHLPGTAFIHVRAPSLVGRHREIAALREAMREATRLRAPRAVLLEGEEGVGKSRLAEWALAECERTGALEGVAARFAPEGGSPARGLRGLVGRLFAPSTRDPAEGARATAAWLGEHGAGAELDVDALAGWLATPTDDDALDPHTAAALAASALRAFAAVRPLYLWLDDALWAADGTHDLAQRLLDAGVGPIVIVVTCNAAALADDRGRARHDALLATGRARRLVVERLDEAGRAALLRAAAPLARSFAAALGRALAATPLVLVQLVADWLDRGLLAPSAEGLVPRGDLGALLDARTPTDVFRHRATGLLGALREAAPMLHAIALLGPWCSARTLHHVGARLGLDREAIDVVVDEAIVRGVVRSEGGGAYRLEHQLFRVELVRAAASDPGYTTLAAAVVQALLDVHGHERPEVRAYAAMWLREAGRRRHATELLLEATDLMARGGDLEAAARQMAIARRWLDEDRTADDAPARDLATYVEARLAYFGLAYDEALAAARAASARYAARGDVEQLLRARNLELRILFYADHLSACEALLRDVRRELGHAITPGSFSHQHHLHLAADLAVMRDDVEGARDLLHAAVLSVEGTGSAYLVVLCFDLAAAEAALGHHDAARAALARARRERPRMDVYQLAMLRENEHTLALARGERRPRAFYADVVDDRRARGERWALTAARLHLAEHDLRFGEPTGRASALAALDAFAAVPHDEAISHVFLRSIAQRLRAMGEHDLADRAAALLDARLAVGRRGVPAPAAPSPAGAAPVSPTKPSA